MLQAVQRNPGIDLLRGLSIFFVMLLHFNIHLDIKESYLRAASINVIQYDRFSGISPTRSVNGCAGDGR
ncbi:MAG: hypothetical protein KL787_04815 [Taibaiella sp.]|nr:hypothetical protein [Taibaiella sp.]